MIVECPIDAESSHNQGDQEDKRMVGATGRVSGQADKRRETAAYRP